MSVKIDFTKNLGKIKPMHGVGQPPFYGARSFPMFHYLTEAGIPFSRLHDVAGPYGGGRFVDIPNLFRDFDADPEDPASFDFTFTDCLITALMDAKVEPFFRLGVTIENDMTIKAYRIHPPKDPEKWAVICEKVIRHYTEGWADGFRYNIRYWEIWNEPDNHFDPKINQMWTGTPEEYYELYNVTAKHLKKCFPHLKIGGYSSCGFYAIAAPSPAREQSYLGFFDNFLRSVKENGAPLDFFSWHSYAGISDTMKFAAYAREQLDRYGFTDTETTCNEWNPEVNLRGTGRHAALVTGMMLAMQNSPLDSAMFYDARYGVSIYGSMFNPMTAAPFPAYYGFLAFNELYRLGTQAEVCCDDEGVYALAAYKGTEGCIVLANTSAADVPLKLETDAAVTECRILDGERLLSGCRLPEEIPGNTVLCIRVTLA
jgi:hypothetical protein